MKTLINNIKLWWNRYIIGVRTKPIYKEIDIPIFTPQPDITVYELAQHVRFPRMFKNEEELIQWKKELPENLKRHYTFESKNVIVGWDY